MKKKERRWFGVKTIYRVSARGKAKHKDASYTKRTSLIEERVVLLRAKDADEAIKKGEKEARSYAGSIRYRNMYDEKVRLRYLDMCEVYDIGQDPGQNVEVFSATRLVDKKHYRKKILGQVFGAEENDPAKSRRMRFLHHQIANAMTSPASEAGPGAFGL